MRRIAIANHKGGACKTSTAVSLAAFFADAGARVLLLDLDPQGSASTWLGAEGVSGDELLAALLGEEDLAEQVRTTLLDGLFLVPAGIKLAKAERQLMGEAGADTALARALNRLPCAYDLLVIDTPPALNILSLNALAAAGEILVPLECSAMAVGGLLDLDRTIARVRDRLNPELRWAGILPCRVDRTLIARQILALVDERFPGRLLQVSIRESVRMREAWSHRLPIGLYAPTSRAADDYRSLAQMLLLGGPADGRA